MLKEERKKIFISKVVIIGECKFKILNLTEQSRLDCEVYQGDPKPAQEVFYTFVNNTHRKFKNLMIVEELVKLYNIPKIFRSSFTLQASPVTIKSSTSGPVTTYVFIPV